MGKLTAYFSESLTGSKDSRLCRLRGVDGITFYPGTTPIQGGLVDVEREEVPLSIIQKADRVEALSGKPVLRAEFPGYALRFDAESAEPDDGFTADVRSNGCFEASARVVDEESLINLPCLSAVSVTDGNGPRALSFQCSSTRFPEMKDRMESVLGNGKRLCEGAASYETRDGSYLLVTQDNRELLENRFRDTYGDNVFLAGPSRNTAFHYAVGLLEDECERRNLEQDV